MPERRNETRIDCDMW